MLFSLSVNLPQHRKIIRLGKLNAANYRSLKIARSSEDEAITYVFEFITARNNELSTTYQFKIIETKLLNFIPFSYF